MAKKTGICMNLDCDNYKKEVEIEPGGEFECPLCHQPLREGKGRSSGGTTSLGKSKVMIIIGGLVAVAVVAVIIMMSMDKAPVMEPVEVKQTETETTTDDMSEVPVSEEMSEVPDSKPKEPESTTQLNAKGTVDLGYGSYTGDLKNGKPHGYGTITYKQSRKIVSSKDFVANPGDTFEGEFRDGKISGLGYWDHDGNKTAVKP